MATGLSAYLCNSWLNAVGNATSFSVSVPYIKLHVGDPGLLGTSNAAIETIRKSVSFSVASAGMIVSDADIIWMNIVGTQTATYFSAWDSLTAGNFLFSGLVADGSFVVGDTFVISSNNLSATLTVAS